MGIRSVSFDRTNIGILNEAMVPVTLNSFYGENSHWFNRYDFMDGMWGDVIGGNGDWTVLTPDGRLLGHELKAAWAKWKALPAADREPGKVPVKGKPKRMPDRSPPEPPPGTLILTMAQRNLKLDPMSGKYSRLTEADTERWCKMWDDINKQVKWRVTYNVVVHDAVWLLENEWKALIPPDPKKGDRYPLPERFRKRLTLWHLTNRTFCVNRGWSGDEIRSCNLSLVVEETAPILRMRLEGAVAMRRDAVKGDPRQPEQGYEPRLLGFLEYDPARKAFTRFDIVAVGDYWGGSCEGGMRNVGRVPLGISFELASGDPVLDRLLPVGGVAFDHYLELK